TLYLAPFPKYFRPPQIESISPPCSRRHAFRIHPQVSNTKPSEHPFKKVPRQFQERRSVKIVFSPCHNDRRNGMRKMSCVLAALAAKAVAAPPVPTAGAL